MLGFLIECIGPARPAKGRMMTTPASVTRLIHLLRSQDTAVRDMAAGMIWQRYFRELLSLARRNLDRRVRHRADEEDVLQSMFRSFCARQGRGDFHLADRDELWRLLVTITLRKAQRGQSPASRPARRRTGTGRRYRRPLRLELRMLGTRADGCRRALTRGSSPAQ